MIELSHVETYGWEAAVRGMRNPMNSWEKSDSHWCDDNGLRGEYHLGDSDLALAQKLVHAGTDHSKFMRMIGISLDIIAPMYWWKEMDTYRVGVCPNPTDIEYNSTSTMHKITAKEFTREDFSVEHLIDAEAPYKCQLEYQVTDEIKSCWTPSAVLNFTIAMLNKCRELYLETGDKIFWWQLIQLLPSSYNYLRTVTINYAVARNMYHARKNHKQDEWRHLCKALERLPYAKELIVE